MEKLMRRLTQYLRQPVSNASLVVFRILFGLILAWGCFKDVRTGWVHYNLLPDHFHFTYPGFAWVTPLPGNGMIYLTLALGVLALFFAAGVYWRTAGAIFLVGFTYCFLIEKSVYLNHNYLALLLLFLMLCVPAKQGPARNWHVWLLRSQIAIVYLFAALAKCKADWLLRADPMGPWLQKHAAMPVLGSFLAAPSTAYLFSWGGFLFDLLVVPALFYRRTRVPALAFSLVFHLTNAYLFKIGIFPWMMLAATTLLLDPAWPLRWRNPTWAKLFHSETTLPEFRWRPAALAFWAVYALVQLGLPLRHYFLPGDVDWNKEGSRFAWRMLLNRKNGNAVFLYRSNLTPEKAVLDPSPFINMDQYLETKLYPDLAHELAYFMARELEKRGHRDVEVFVASELSLNGRPPKPHIDPERNLAAVTPGTDISILTPLD